MKKKYLLIAFTFLISFGILQGCDWKKEEENINMESNSIESNNIKYAKDGTFIKEVTERPEAILGKSEWTQEEINELEYQPGDILISFKPGKLSFTTEAGVGEIEAFLQKKSEELTPIILEKLIENGKIDESMITDEIVEKLKKSLITYHRRFGSGGGMVYITIYNAAGEISEELAKDENIEGATPNYTIHAISN